MNKKYIIVESIIYILFITFDLLGIKSDFIKYLGIILCFLYSIYNRKKLTSLALLFTLISDFFLLVINKYYELGLITFNLVQLIYLYYLGNSKRSLFTTIRLILMAIGIYLCFTNKLISLLNVLVVIYFCNLVVNAIKAYYKKEYVFAIGLTLFVCCDICVGLYNLLPYNKLIAMGMWIFYLPSQALITLGTKNSTN